MVDILNVELPGLDCGMCGCHTCDEFQKRLISSPELIERCIHLSGDQVGRLPRPTKTVEPVAGTAACGGSCATCADALTSLGNDPGQPTWLDSLGREFDFYLEHFPDDPGPREIILPHNPALTRELDVREGDLLIGRPLGMSCGCPITHCGVVVKVEARTGVIVWCVTGPLGPRQEGFKDLGYYIAEGYEGLVTQTRAELKVGLRYFFQPRMCMLQWRHSGLINYLSHNADGYQVRLEGLWIG